MPETTELDLSPMGLPVGDHPDTDTEFIPSFRSDMDVELIKTDASDHDVVMAARVSTQGEYSRFMEGELGPDEEGLIGYLMRDRHGSPFEHSHFTFYVCEPLFVTREFHRHRIASYNEESGRYRVMRPVFYVPDNTRKLVQVGRPGKYTFVDGTPEQHELVQTELHDGALEQYARYRRLLDGGIAKEIARMPLPLTLYSSFYVSINARSLMNFLSLRTKSEISLFPSFPQREIEMVAEKMEAVFAERMPITYAAFVRSGRVAP